jgi:hypothetical protein
VYSAVAEFQSSIGKVIRALVAGGRVLIFCINAKNRSPLATCWVLSAFLERTGDVQQYVRLQRKLSFPQIPSTAVDEL